MRRNSSSVLIWQVCLIDILDYVVVRGVAAGVGAVGGSGTACSVGRSGTVFRAGSGVEHRASFFVK